MKWIMKKYGIEWISPRKHIIISQRESFFNEDKNILQDLEKIGAVVVTSELPEKNFLNMKHQMISTNTGLKKAKELNCKYVIKTRTDQRLYETNIPEFLVNLLQSFPLDKKVNGQQHRLITTSFNTFKYRLYDVNDMFLFGHIDDIYSELTIDNVDQILEKIGIK